MLLLQVRRMKNKVSENYLDFVFEKNPCIKWNEEDKEIILEQENKGLFNRLAQKLLKKPAISYIHLEEMGSFIWPLIDGQKSLYDIGQIVHEAFGEKAEPLYPRLSTYFKQLENCGFIQRL